MLIVGDNRLSQIRVCLEARAAFQLSAPQAASIVGHQITVIRDQWDRVCDEAGLSAVDRRLLWRRQIFNPFALQDAPAQLIALVS